MKLMVDVTPKHAVGRTSESGDILSFLSFIINDRYLRSLTTSNTSKQKSAARALQSSVDKHDIPSR